MMNDLSIMGRLVATPELKKTQSGVSVAQMKIACERSYAKPGEQRVTDFFEVTAWRQTAEFACKYFQKGQLIAVSGSIQNEKWEDKNGNKRVTTKIIAERLHFAESSRAAPKHEQDNGGPDIDPADDFQTIDESEDLPF